MRIKRFKCCKESNRFTFMKQGKFLIFSLLIIWLGISLHLSEINPIEWPNIYKPFLFIFICPLYAYLSQEKI
jgi:hypothetical protein